MLELQDGIRKIDKHFNHSHGPTQTKQEMPECIVGTFLVHGRATGNTDSKDLPWPGLGGSHHLPLILCLTTGLALKCHFVSRLPSGRVYSEILEIGTFVTLKAHNFTCRRLIEVRTQTKL